MVPLPIVQPETAGAVCGEKIPDVRVVALSFLWRALSVSVWSPSGPPQTRPRTLGAPTQTLSHYGKAAPLQQEQVVC